MAAKLGERYGRLVTISVAESFVYRRQRHRQFLCQCDCGNSLVVQGRHLVRESTKSCGCLHQEGPWKISHGEGSKPTRSPEYICWTGMKQRCSNPDHDSYERYGGRGITVCDRWVDSFENFLADMGRKPSAAHSIDREDNDGNYEPGNCRWATGVEQQANRACSRAA